jgi:tRNA-Thr(GGU) m(6)t(6)A37 methyltransferase TsaA
VCIAECSNSDTLGDIVVKQQPDRVLTLRPIGHVENGVQKGEQAIWEELESRIVLDSQWAEGLQGLEEFSHLVVIFWLDRPSETEVPLQVHPEAREDMPLVGLFASRTPLRPNPLGVTTVELLHVQGNELTVRGLDAFDGTPVLDIKPYLIRGDLKPQASVPGWLRQLWEKHDTEE